MPRGGKANLLYSGPLSREEAAAYIGFTPQTFRMWLRCGLLPVADVTTGGWTKGALDDAIERVKRDGVQNDNPSRRHSHFVKIPNAQRIWKKLQQGDGAGHWLFYFRPTSERLPGPWGSPAFMQSLIACERRYAGRLAVQSAPSPAPLANQPPAAPQSSAGAGQVARKLVTRISVSETKDQPPRTPADLVARMRRRRAAVTQAEIARIIRAAKQAGATEVEVRMAEHSKIVIRLHGTSTDEPLATESEVVL
jgi:hypothetical protein